MDLGPVLGAGYWERLTSVLTLERVEARWGFGGGCFVLSCEPYERDGDMAPGDLPLVRVMTPGDMLAAGVELPEEPLETAVLEPSEGDLEILRVRLSPVNSLSLKHPTVNCLTLTNMVC